MVNISGGSGVGTCRNRQTALGATGPPHAGWPVRIGLQALAVRPRPHMRHPTALRSFASSGNRIR